MKYVVDRTVNSQESNSITILVNEDVKITLTMDNENNLVIHKSDLGLGSHAISITPNVSNQITVS